MLCIRHATILTPWQRIQNGALLTEGTRIAALGQADAVPCPRGAEIVDAGGLFLVPGFIDLQINGAFGHDFTADPSAIWRVASQLPRYGVTAFLPTIISSPLENIAKAQAALARGPASNLSGAIPLGLHLEGPFLNSDKKGAHNPTYLREPSLNTIRDWSPAQGVRMVTLAPELPGALGVIEALAARGVVVGAGHSMASYAQAQAGFQAGITYGTHLFNAMICLGHREPGLAGALLTDPRVTVGLIADGIHLHPALVSLIWQAKGRARVSLVTDAMGALGMSPGTHLLGDFQVTVDGTSARLADGSLAGSILSLDRALGNVLSFAGCSLQQALPSVTSTAAAVLGVAGQRGKLAPGLAADLVLLTSSLDVALTVVGGKVVHRRQPALPGSRTP